MAWLLELLVLYLAPWGVQADCLPEAIPESQRQSLRQDGVAAYPIGLYLGDWEAAHLATRMVQILLQEKLGYQAEVTGVGVGALDAFYALTGCTQPANLTNRGCGPTVTYNHINMETWMDSYVTEWEHIQATYPSMAPVDVGSMGYKGRISMFLPREPLNRAYYDDGFALDFYRNWNRSWSQPWNYFDSLSSVSRSRLMPCNQTRFTATKTNEDYLRLTGDQEGVRRVDGELWAWCPDGYFWLAPACRTDTSKCVPWFTGGAGWSVDDAMQKATAYDMPLAVGVAQDYARLPNEVASTFFWWSPDTTFLEMSPVEIGFPEFDFTAWAVGDKRTGSQDNTLAKLVSQDLAGLAPNAVELIRNLRLPIGQMNLMMMDRLRTGDSYEEVACRWLQSSPTLWESWLPDKTKCFPGFGLYDASQMAFVDNRDDPTYLECRACVSGKFSSRMDDSRGVTYACVPCKPGTSQASGAALFCDECQLGEYMNSSGSLMCERCGLGDYQDQRGQALCIPCPDGSTLGLGSVSLKDCGCEAGFIDVGNESLDCVECGHGLDCPILSKLADLKSGSTSLGEDFLPQTLPHFYSSQDQPLEVYLCADAVRCPGGRPGVCGGGLERAGCTDCPEGQTYTGRQCTDCSAWRAMAWVAVMVLIFFFLVAAYYLMTSASTAKASVLFTTTCAMGMTVSMLQTVGIVGMMTVDFPPALSSLMKVLQLFVLDIDSYSFNCIAGNNAIVRYIATALFFPVAINWLLLCHFSSKLLPQRWRRYRWEWTKAKSTMGQFLQVGFSTMSTTAMAPMMCFRHPHGGYSLLKYPSVACGTEDHTVMLVVGLLLLLVGVIGFLVLCAYVVLMAPRWTEQGKHERIRAARFLVFRFRLDSWWYGVPLLTRGPLLSLPIVLATDHPPVQVMFVTFILVIFLTLETRAWPWKVPLLNVVDCLMSLCITMLVAASSLHLDPLDKSMTSFAEALSTGISAVLGLAMVLLATATLSALIFKSALGSQKEPFLFNLQTPPKTEEVFLRLQSVARELTKMDGEEVKQAVANMSLFDVNLLLKCMALLSLEVMPHAPLEGVVAVQQRLSAGSFAAPKAKAKAQAKAVPQKPQEVEKSPELAVEQREPVELEQDQNNQRPVFMTGPMMRVLV